MQKDEISNKDKSVSKNENDNSSNGFFKVLLTTFTTILIAELGDKTQIATLLLAAQSAKPIVVFLGSAVALVLSSLLGILLGKWLSSRLAPETFEYLAGSVMLIIGITIGIEAAYSIIF